MIHIYITIPDSITSDLECIPELREMDTWISICNFGQTAERIPARILVLYD